MFRVDRIHDFRLPDNESRSLLCGQARMPLPCRSCPTTCTATEMSAAGFIPLLILMNPSGTTTILSPYPLR